MVILLSRLSFSSSSSSPPPTPATTQISPSQAMKLDLEYKDEKISALSKDLEDLGGGGGGATDEEVAVLKRAKADLEMRLKDQV